MCLESRVLRLQMHDRYFSSVIPMKLVPANAGSENPRVAEEVGLRGGGLVVLLPFNRIRYDACPVEGRALVYLRMSAAARARMPSTTSVLASA